MKNGWQTKKLGELCEIELGRTPARANNAFWDEKRETGNVWLSIADLLKGEDNIVVDSKEYVSDKGAAICKLVPKGTLLVSFKLTLGRLAFAGRDLFTNEAIAALSIFNERELSKEFLFYFLHFFDWVKAAENDVKLKGMTLNKAKLKEMPVHFPMPPEQQRIVGILDEAFEGIAKARANAEINLQNARALFESYLQSVVTQHSTKWVEKKLGDESLLEIIDGDRGVNYPKASDFHDEGHCLFLNTKNVRPDGFDFETTMFITAEKDGQLRKGKLKRDDVVLTTRGTVGNIGLYSEDVPFDNIRINSGMLIFRTNKRTLLPSFLFELLRSDIIKGQIKKQTTGAAQPQLPIKTLVNFTIPVPVNLDDQRALVKKLRAFEPESQRLESIYQQKLVALDALKRSLLHQAFSGRL
jgi:type I restriction enzyme S subunit